MSLKLSLIYIFKVNQAKNLIMVESFVKPEIGKLYRIKHVASSLFIGSVGHKNDDNAKVEL
jgi:hypothetical protein